MGILRREDGVDQRQYPDVSQLEAAGYKRCYTNDWSASKAAGAPKLPCPFWLSPETVSMVVNQMGGYYTCPICERSHDLLHELPWHGVPEEYQQAHNYAAGGGTRIGLSMTEQAEIGEQLVANIGTLGEYGPITWWHGGGAAANSPLDGATQNWGIEVKTIGYDAMHHRFVPGGRRARANGAVHDEKAEKDQQAKQMGKLGVLGILVLLDYRRSVADIYAREFPLERGVGSFRSHQGGTQHLIKEVPFQNPLMDPHSPAPQVNTGLSAFAEQNEKAPF